MTAMFIHHSSSPATFLFITIALFQVTKCSHIEIRKAESLEFNKQKNYGRNLGYLTAVAVGIKT
ncbi:CLUMA_CG008515, isoform A [Clunio marinus]|uniref:CLUMA_CG008515, isoform A n=1 Tax=Clunio marinus TaxID=568069 RepID=A0A1J1I409_9DIPT|nr:CLUMA_CG008515, isoform A [Clunio marinus]